MEIESSKAKAQTSCTNTNPNEEINIAKKPAAVLIVRFISVDSLFNLSRFFIAERSTTAVRIAIVVKTKPKAVIALVASIETIETLLVQQQNVSST